MKKEIIITPENLHLQKLSDVFESVLVDLNGLKAKKLVLDMGSWTNIYSEELCTVCLGGAAICGFLPVINKEILKDVSDLIIYGYKKINGFTFERKVADRLENMAMMFDAFRYNNIRDVLHYWEKISNTSTSSDIVVKIFNEYKGNSYSGFMHNSELKNLKADIKDFIKTLRSHKL